MKSKKAPQAKALLSSFCAINQARWWREWNYDHAPQEVYARAVSLR